MSYTLANAITGTYPDYAIDPSKVLVSHGSLAPAAGVSATPAGGGTITLAWENNSGVGNAKQADKVLIAVVNPAKSGAVYDCAGADRMTTMQDMILPADRVGDDVEFILASFPKTTRKLQTACI
jgi:hypothetical protein